MKKFVTVLLVVVLVSVTLPLGVLAAPGDGSVPTVTAAFDGATNTVALNGQVSGSTLFYYLSYTPVNPGQISQLQQQSLQYFTPFSVMTSTSSSVYIICWYGNDPAHAGLYQSLNVVVNAPVPSVKLETNPSNNTVSIKDIAATTLPMFAYVGDASSAQLTNEQRQAASPQYVNPIAIDPQYDTRDIYVWHSKDPAFAARYQMVVYQKDPNAPLDVIRIEPSFDWTYGRVVLTISSDATLGAFDIFYTISVGSSGSTGTPVRYTQPVNLSKGASYYVEAYYSSDGGVTKQNITNKTFAIDEKGGFTTVAAPDLLSTAAKGKYLMFSGSGNGLVYDIKVQDGTSGATLKTITKTGVFKDEVYLLADTVSSYSISYTIMQAGKTKAVQIGDIVSVDSTYMPEPFNLKWNKETMVASADVTMPADSVEYEMYNTVSQDVYQKNTTGIFNDVPSGQYELRATAFNKSDPTLRSKTITLNVVHDNDPPSLTLIPLTVAGSTPGVIIQTDDAGSGIDRILVTINGTSQPNAKNGDTIYATVSGTNTISVTVYDKVGNKTSKTETLTFDKNTLNPVIELSVEDTDKKGNPIEWFKDKLTVNVTATNAASKLRYLHVADGGKALKVETRTPAEPTIMTSVDLDKSGRYNIKAYAVSEDGKPSGNEAQRTVNIDMEAPDKPTLKLTGTKLYLEADDNLSGINYIEYTIEGGDTDRYYPDGDPDKDDWEREDSKGNTTRRDGEDKEYVVIKGDGELRVTATAVDYAGNKSEATKRTFTLDNVAPKEPTIDGAKAEWYISEEEVKVSFTPGADGNTDEDNKVVIKYKVTAGKEVAKTWSTFKEGDESLVFSDDGIYKVQALSEDSAGNQSATVTGYVKLDRSPPSMRVTALSPFTATTKRASFRINFADKGAGIDKLYVTVAGRESRINLSAKHKVNGYVNITLDLPSDVGVTTTTTSANLNGASFGTLVTDPNSGITLQTLANTTTTEELPEHNTLQTLPVEDDTTTAQQPEQYTYTGTEVKFTIHDKAGNNSSVTLNSTGQSGKGNPYTGD